MSPEYQEENIKEVYEFLYTDDRMFDLKGEIETSLIFFDAQIYRNEERSNIVAVMSAEKWGYWFELFRKWNGFLPDMKEYRGSIENTKGFMTNLQFRIKYYCPWKSSKTSEKEEEEDEYDNE